MSLQSALQFIQQTRRDAALQAQLQALGWRADLAAIAQLGAACGLVFTVEELRTAFKHDWAMRWTRYSANTFGAAPERRSSE